MLWPKPKLNITHVFLIEHATGLGATLQAFLICTASQQQICIYCMHGMLKFVGSIDGRSTPWDSKCFAFLGDLTQGIATSIESPEEAFCVVANLRVWTLKYFQEHLDEIGAGGMPFLQADEPTTALITTRNMIYIPAKYAQFLSRSSGCLGHLMTCNHHGKWPADVCTIA